MSSVRSVLRTVLTQVNGARAVVESSPLERASLDTEPPCAVDAPVVENATNHSIPVGEPVSGFGAFLDGRQDSRVVAWVGAQIPLVLGTVSAGIQIRVDRRLRSWGETVVERRMYAPLALVDASSLYAACDPLPVVDTLAREDDPLAPMHPALLEERARQAVLRDRERAEQRVGAAWCAAGEAALFVDGGIAASDELSQSPLAVGVVKSHRTLYGDADGVAALLELRKGERTRVVRIAPGGRRRPVHSWYLRLRDPAGHDGLWGLVRIEVAESGEPTATADLVSRWVLAERAPLAAPDARWDRMAYGVRAVEQALGAVARPTWAT